MGIGTCPIEQLFCRGKRLLRDMSAADDACDFRLTLFPCQLAHVGLRSAVLFRFGDEKMGVGNRGDLRRMGHADDLCPTLGYLVQLDADFVGGPAGDSRIDFIENQRTDS